MPSDNGREFCGREFCGREDRHPYELFLQLEGIQHKRTRVSRPQSNGIVERLHRTLLDEHFRIEGRKTWFETIEEMQTVLDAYLVGYNTERPHQGRGMGDRTPAKAFVQGIPKCNRKEEHTTIKTAARPRKRRPRVSADIHLCTLEDRTHIVETAQELILIE